jgi:hypothetical protein
MEMETGKLHLSGQNITIWLSDNFSKDWYMDALEEAGRFGENDQNLISSIRREILFSICFLESYIFEWTRGLVQIEEIEDFFPSKQRFKDDPKYRRSLKDKWKNIPKELYEVGKISKIPSLELSGLGNLLKHRHGLVHAASSRPVTNTQTETAQGFPTKEDLRKLSPGWATRIAHNLVESLHTELGTAIPDYLHL